MKPGRFDFQRVRTAEELTGLLAQHGSEAQILAGGQSLVPMLNMRVARPALLIDINGIEAFAGVTRTQDHLELGALTRHRMLLSEPAVAAAVPLLALAAPYVAHPAVRNRGTIGGSLALADPSAELPAVSVLLGACVRIVSPERERWCAADDFFLGPMETSLGESEVIAAVRFPSASAGSRFAFREIARRHGDYAVCGVAGLADSGTGSLRMCLFGVTGRPVIVSNAARCLEQDEPASLQVIKDAILQDTGIEDSASDPVEYRLHLAAVMLRRVAAELRADKRG